MIITKEFILGLDRIIINDCWVRPDYINDYSVIFIDGRKLALHRLVAAIWHDLDLNDDKQLACHKCNNKPCFNPEHIYSGTYHTNLIDAVNSKSHGQVKRNLCKLGHLLDGIKTRRGKVRERYCKTCQKMANIRYRGY